MSTSQLRPASACGQELAAPTDLRWLGPMVNGYPNHLSTTGTSSSNLAPNLKLGISFLNRKETIATKSPWAGAWRIFGEI